MLGKMNWKTAFSIDCHFIIINPRQMQHLTGKFEINKSSKSSQENLELPKNNHQIPPRLFNVRVEILFAIKC